MFLGNITVNIDTNLGDVIDEFLCYQTEKGNAKATVDYYKNALKSVFRNYDKETPIDSIDWGNVVKEINVRTDITDYSKTTYLRALRGFLSYNKIDYHIRIREIETVKNVYTDDEIRKLLVQPKKASFTEYKVYTMVCLAVDTGIRLNSIRNIKVGDIQDSDITISNTKSHKIQILPFSKTTKSALKTYMKYRGGSEGDILFPNIYGEKLSKDLPAQELQIYCRHRGIKSKGWHAFRHYFAKSNIKNGTSAILLQRYLGHSSLKTTQVYCQGWEETLIDNYKSPIDSLTRHRLSSH